MTLAVVFVAVDTAVLLRSLTRPRHFVTGGALARAVGQRLAESVDTVLPTDHEAGAPTDVWTPPPGIPLVHAGRPSVIQEVDERRLLRHAAHCQAQVPLDAGAGQCIGVGAVLGQVHGLPTAPGPRRDRQLRRFASCVRVGGFRAVGQDPAYGLRLLVDIAARALSPAVNDPTTACRRWTRSKRPSHGCPAAPSEQLSSWTGSAPRDCCSRGRSGRNW